MNINFKITKEELKEKIAKGIILLTLTGTLVSNGPVKSSKGATIEVRTSTEVDTDDESIGTLKLSNDKNVTSASASVTATADIETVRKDALKELKSVYKTYNKKYYKAKSYTKLTKYYKTAVSKVKKAKTVNDIDVICKKYETLMNNIKPTYLINYQKKMETKLLTSYKSLITKNTYSDNNLETIEDIKNEGINKIYETKTKTQAKKVKNTYTNNLKTVKNVLDETKEAAYNYINSIKDLNKTEKNKLIDQVSKMTKEDDVIVLMEKNGYDPKGVIEEYVETDPNKMTKEILNDEKKLDELLEDWDNQFEDDYNYFWDFNGQLVMCDKYTNSWVTYLLNYQYIDSSFTSTRVMDYFTMCLGTNFDINEYKNLADEWWGIVYTHLKRGQNLDYGRLIIEDNNSKGVGKLINKMISAINAEDYKKLNDYFAEYFDKYLQQNIVLDSIVVEMKSYTYSKIYNLSNYIMTPTKAIESESKFNNLKEEYLFSKLNSKEYKKTISKD